MASGLVTEVVGPGGRQAQQSQRVARWGGVEQDLVVPVDRVRVGEEAGERVERGDLDGARSSQLLLERGDLGLGEDAPVRVDHP